MNRAILVFCLLFSFGISVSADDEPKRIHVIVALCDNEHQGIAPVNARIGNGEDLENNLYWGCSDGLNRYFRNSKDWTLVESKKADREAATEGDADGQPVLETLIFKHKSTGALLTAEAFRGREIKASIQKFVDLLNDETNDLVAYIGHNGLMEFGINQEIPAAARKMKKDAVVLCCKSDAYFTGILKKADARPILMTDQFMYPGSFLLKAAVDGWLRGESTAQIRERAAKAYVTNQKIRLSAARGVFTDPEKLAQ